MSAFQQKSSCTLPTPLLLGRIGLNQERIKMMKSKIDFDQYTDLASAPLPQEIISKLQPILPHLQTCKDVMDLVKRNIDYFNTISGGGSGETRYCLEKTGGADVPWQTPEPFPGYDRLHHAYNTCYLCGLPILNKDQAVVTPADITPEEQQLYNISKGILKGYSSNGEEITLQNLELLENPINVWAFNSVVAELKVSNDRLAAQNETPKSFDRQSIKKKITESYQTHPMYPEGEHVIDYKRAGYMNILSTDGRKYDKDNPLSEAWRHQYAWAHRCCNQFKSQGDFCYWDSEQQFFYPSPNIKAFYDEMAKSDSKYAHVQYFHGPNGPLRRNFLGWPLPQRLDPNPSLQKAMEACKTRVDTILFNINLNWVARIENIFSSECLNNLFVSKVLAAHPGGGGKEILTTLNRAEDIDKKKNDLKSSVDNLLNDWTAIGAGGLFLDPTQSPGTVWGIDNFTTDEQEELSNLLAGLPDDGMEIDEQSYNTGQEPARNPSAPWPDVNKFFKIKSHGKSIIDVEELQQSIGAVPIPVQQRGEKREAFKKAAANITLQAEEEARKRGLWEEQEKKLQGNIQQVIATINSIGNKEINCGAIVEQFMIIANNLSNGRVHSAYSGFPDRIISDLHSKFKFTALPDGSIYVEQRESSL
jgi:hypothetical protein